MDEIKARLQTTSENCFKTYEAWTGDKKNSGLQEELQEAVHELRRVASRLEIEMAVNERSTVKHDLMNDSNNRGNSNNNKGSKPRGRKPSGGARKPRGDKQAEG